MSTPHEVARRAQRVADDLQLCSAVDRTVIHYLHLGMTASQALGRVGDTYADFPCRTRTLAIGRCRKRMLTLGDIEFTDVGPAAAELLAEKAVAVLSGLSRRVCKCGIAWHDGLDRCPSCGIKYAPTRKASR